MSVQHNSYFTPDENLVDPLKERILSAEERAMIVWAAGSLQRMSEVYERMPERDESQPEYDRIDGRILLSNN